MMNQRKLISGLFIGMIAMSVISLSFSIAWYAASTHLMVSPVILEIDSDRELKISTTANPEDFTDKLNYEDLNQNVGKFAPVSTVFSYAWVSSRANKPIFYDQSFYWGSVGEPDRKEAIYGFFSQELYLTCDDDVYVTVDMEESFIKENEEYNVQYAEQIYDSSSGLSKEDIVSRLNLLTKAMRFSILVPLSEEDDDSVYSYSVIDPNKQDGEEVLFGGVLDNRNDRNDHCYDSYVSNGEIYETVYGDVNDRSLIQYDDKLTSDILYQGENSAFNATHKEGTRPFNYEKSVANGMSFAKEESLSKKDLTEHPEKIRIPVSKDIEKPRKIIVSIYIEGWDQRSINSTMGASFLANLSFKINREIA